MTLHGGGTDQMALLYGDLDLRDAAQMVDQLGRTTSRTGSARNGSQIMVPADQVAGARLMLAKDGLPSGGSIGYEIFDRGDSFAPPSSSRRSTRPARWRASWRAPSAPSTACARRACIWCCRSASRSRATSRTRRPA